MGGRGFIYRMCGAGGGTHGSRPTTVFVGLACPAGSAVRCRRADRGVRPYGSATRGAMGGRPQGSPLRKRILRCVGEGLSCPPLCRPTDGHCRARQSGHFLETGSLHPPLAALRRFPRPRATARVAPTEWYCRVEQPKFSHVCQKMAVKTRSMAFAADRALFF